MKTTSKHGITGRRRAVVAALAGTALVGGLATVAGTAFADGHGSHPVSVSGPRKAEDRPGADAADPDRGRPATGTAASAPADRDRRHDEREPEHHRDAEHTVVVRTPAETAHATRAAGTTGHVEARHDEPGDRDHRGDHDEHGGDRDRGGHHDGRDNDG